MSNEDYPTKISPLAFLKDASKVHLAQGARIDEFARISTTCHIGRFVHICTGVSIAGGLENKFTIGDHSAVSSGSRIWLQSDDYVNDVNSYPIHSSLEGNITMERYTCIGSNSVVMPNNHIPEGTVIGALSFVPYNFKFEEWSVYAGVPIRFIKKRNKESILKQVEEFEKSLR